jgi:hypothetical protein
MPGCDLVTRCLTCLLALSFVGLCVAASAHAQSTLVTDSYQLAGERSELALAGDATLVGSPDGETTNLILSFALGRAPQVIARARLRPVSGEFGDSMYFVASATRFVMLDQGSSFAYKGTGETRYEKLLSGALGAAALDLSPGCGLAPSIDQEVGIEPGVPRHSALAIDGEVVVYDSFGCVMVRDFATGLERVIPLEATLAPVVGKSVQYLKLAQMLSVAGRLVAYRANQPDGEGPASVVVYDIDSDRQLYRVALAEAQPTSEDPERPTFALQSDGTLVIANPTTCQATVSTLATPAPSPLGVSACEVSALHDGRALLVTPGPGRDRSLAWTSLQAPALHPLADLGVGAALQPTPAQSDGSEVVYALAGCWAPSVYRTPLVEPGAPAKPPSDCPVSAPLHRVTLTAKALRFRLRCPLGCEGNLEAQLGTARQLRSKEGGESITGSLPNVSISPGGEKTFSLPCNAEEEAAPAARALARRLRRGVRLELGLDFHIDTPAGNDLGDYEAQQLGVRFSESSHLTLPIRLQ